MTWPYSFVGAFGVASVDVESDGAGEGAAAGARFRFFEACVCSGTEPLVPLEFPLKVISGRGEDITVYVDLICLIW